MKISHVHIRNFRQHRDISLDLSGDRGNFVVLRGLNGAGKTNFLKAVTWAITGTLGRSEQRFQPQSLLSFGAISDAEAGEIVELSVELGLELESAGKAELKRVFSFSTRDDEVEARGTVLSVNVYDPQLGWRKEAEPDLWLEKNLPSRFSHYFLFDGEQLEKFFQANEARFVQGAVLEIAQIDNLGRMVERLGQVQSDLYKEVAHQAKGEKGEDLEAVLRDIEKQESEFKEKLEVKNEQQQDLEVQLAEAKARLGDIQAAQAELRRRDTLERQVLDEQSQLNDLRAGYESWAVAMAPFAMMHDAVEKLEAEIARAREEKVLPPAYDPEALRELISSKTCVCGRDLEADKDAKAHIEQVIAEYAALSAAGAALTSVEAPLARAAGRFSGRTGEGLAVVEKMRERENRLKDAQAKYEALRKQLADHDEPQIAAISKSFDSAVESLKKVSGELEKVSRELEDLKLRKAQVQKDIEQSAAKGAKAQSLKASLDFTEKLIESSSALYEDLQDRVRLGVAENLDREFSRMIWKKDAFEPVQIDEDYRVQVINKRGFETREGLSAGETACLAFAFALTLSKVAGFYFPMVVDSPLGRLSGEVKKSVAGVLTDFLEDDAGDDAKQLIMLMTDEEYDAQVAEVLNARAPQVFDIAFDQASGESRLESDHG